MATARALVVIGSDGHPQQLQTGDVLRYPPMTVAQLNALTGIVAGAQAYASNGRAQTAPLGTLEAANAGSGVDATFNGKSAWVITGTNIPVLA